MYGQKFEKKHEIS